MSKNKKTKSQKFQQPESNFIKHNYIYLILIFIVAYYLYLCNKVGFIQDDTYITLQYAKHFADGNGLVFNIGQRVEGFTSLIWVLLLSFTYKLGFNIESVSQVLSITFGAVNLVMSYFILPCTLFCFNYIKRFRTQNKSANVTDYAFSCRGFY